MRPSPIETTTVAVVAFEGISPFHLSVPCLVFGEDRSSLGVAPFKLLVCSAEGRHLRTSAGFDIVVAHGLEALRHAQIVIVPSWRDVGSAPSPALLAALRRAHRRGAQIVGLCLGAFVLAEAGLLDGRPATTHWGWAEAFAERYPNVQLDAEVLYVDDGDVLTSAGTAAGLDCCLHLLRQRCGVDVANRVARRLVVAPHRQGGQAQFIEQPVPATRRGDRLTSLLAWASERLDEPHSVDSLAERAAMSRRTFTRHFRKATGTTLLQWLLNQRLARARGLLESTDRGVESVAVEAGFGSAVSLRQHFAAALGTTPSSYRAQFRGAETAEIRA
jgi:transcriptional regulator GlxA family with amidase domain